MRNNPIFSDGLCYLDLFCGAGASQVDIDGSKRKYPGSPIIAASFPDGFRKLIFVDKDKSTIESLQKRISKFAPDKNSVFLNRDANVSAQEIISHIPQKSLCITFIDPYSLDIHFDTIKELSSSRMDLIILFSDRFDLGRNVHKYYYPPEEVTKLDRFLGEELDWKSRFDQLDNHSGLNVRTFFAELYIEQLSKIGYAHCKHWPLRGPGGDAFRLIYACKNELGLKYCGIAMNEDLDGTKSLFDLQ